MPSYKLLIEVQCNGQPYIKADADELADMFHTCRSNITRKAAVGGVMYMGEDKYVFRITSEKVPRRDLREKKKKPKPKKRKKMSALAEMEQRARAAGMHYGYFVGLNGIK